MAHVHEHTHCPTCGQPHTTIEHGVLKCSSADCKAVWRRVDIELEAQQSKARLDIRQQEYESFRQLNTQLNTLTNWILDRRPGWLTGKLLPVQLAIKALEISDSMGTLPVQSPHLGLENKGRLKAIWHAVRILR